MKIAWLLKMLLNYKNEIFMIFFYECTGIKDAKQNISFRR